VFAVLPQPETPARTIKIHGALHFFPQGLTSHALRFDRPAEPAYSPHDPLQRPHRNLKQTVNVAEAKAARSRGEVWAWDDLSALARGVTIFEISYYPEPFMPTLTLKIPDKLDAALRTASAKRQVGKSEFVRQALNATLEAELRETEAASRWLARWSNCLAPMDEAALDDARLEHLLQKHLK
jgi:predicted transcriptional regulator